MKWLLAISLLIFLMASPAYSQGSEEQLNEIRGWFKEINAQTDDYEAVHFADIKVSKNFNPENYSIEGSELYAPARVDLTKYFEGENLLKMVVNLFGDRDDLTSAYYLRNGELFFVDKEKTNYKRPRWHEEFNASEKSTTKNRFYIKNKQILKWINADGLSITETDPAFHDTQETLQNDFNVYLQVEE